MVGVDITFTSIPTLLYADITFTCIPSLHYASLSTMYRSHHCRSPYKRGCIVTRIHVHTQPPSLSSPFISGTEKHPDPQDRGMGSGLTSKGFWPDIPCHDCWVKYLDSAIDHSAGEHAQR